MNIQTHKFRVFAYVKTMRLRDHRTIHYFKEKIHKITYPMESIHKIYTLHSITYIKSHIYDATLLIFPSGLLNALRG